MKRIIIGLICLSFVCIGCTPKNDWADWRAQNEAWMAKNKQNEGVQVTPTGLQYKVIQQGVPGSLKPDNEKVVVINYTGTLITGDVFDLRENYEATVSGFIPGFVEGLKRMNQAGRYILYIPADLAYKADGTGSSGEKNFIPPYSTVIFDITLLNVYE